MEGRSNSFLTSSLLRDEVAATSESEAATEGAAGDMGEVTIEGRTEAAIRTERIGARRVTFRGRRSQRIRLE